MRSSLRRTVAVLFALSSTALAVPVLQVFPSIGPNPGSPNFNAYTANALNALLSGSSTGGTPGTPAYYSQTSGPLLPSSILSTSFPSWNGVADPAAPFNSELGNWIYFGLVIRDNASPSFSLSQLGLTDNLFGNTSSCPAPCFSDYRSDLFGIHFGGNGVLGGGDDSIFSSGASTTQINMLIYIGNAFAFNIAGAGQAAIDAAIYSIVNASVPQADKVAQTIYTLGTQPPVETTLPFDLGIPEPATYGMMALGLAALVLRKRA